MKVTRSQPVSLDLRSLAQNKRRLSVNGSNALDNFAALEDLITVQKLRLVLLLDYDGTLTEIVSDPSKALLSEEVRDTLKVLPQHYVTGIVSGRSLSKIRDFVRVPGLCYAGSHGFDILMPAGEEGASHATAETNGVDKEKSDDEKEKEKREGSDVRYQVATEFLPALQDIRSVLEEGVKDIAGAEVEDNIYSISVHYRNCARSDVEKVTKLVTDLKDRNSWLRLKGGKEVYELQPDIKWNKGCAVVWLLGALGLKDPEKLPLKSVDESNEEESGEHTEAEPEHTEEEPEVDREKFFVIYIGDDTTDEDAFKVFLGNQGKAWQPGVGILVSEESKETNASYTLKNPTEVAELLRRLVKIGQTQNIEPIGLSPQTTVPAVIKRIPSDTVITKVPNGMVGGESVVLLAPILQAVTAVAIGSAI